MGKVRSDKEQKLESTVRDILKSRAQSRIYLYLLRKNGAKTEQIIKGTRLHPSTVRETLSKMNAQGLIYRKKIKNDSIGKNPYKYYPLPPLQLLKKYASEMEERLNRFAALSFSKNNSSSLPFRQVQIKIYERDEKP